ncbi:MAG: hypothetical protein JRN16_08945 [Nitrososphaerota archaeon]|jgi:hypothetical protein|nr:hypothetical protein [Nitrososphaerota archaeon]MDG6938207.1 hypothetical protein [Nitrososphaerota archaeon]MDG6956899.1 hypothetical protein [Nitrososphaerota archaeon]MDG6960212.1 hypothetical protein [Nitrososphaerota archaeon]MDG6962195.1 hypothetical protein [Nitrososphaerota archaeon]
MTLFDLLLFLFLFCTGFFSFLVVFYQAWRGNNVVKASPGAGRARETSNT